MEFQKGGQPCVVLMRNHKFHTCGPMPRNTYFYVASIKQRELRGTDANKEVRRSEPAQFLAGPN